MKCFHNIERSNVIMVKQQNVDEVSTTDAVENIDTNQQQGNVEGRDIINRLSKVEEDIITVFKKLDDITANIDSNNELNITRLSKIDEDNIRLF